MGADAGGVDGGGWRGFRNIDHQGNPDLSFTFPDESVKPTLPSNVRFIWMEDQMHTIFFVSSGNDPDYIETTEWR